jgi:CubicO group peptidase (beta-lactamase class C family)
MSCLRFVLAILAVLIAGVVAAPAQDRPLETALQQAFDAGELRGLHGVAVRLNGRVLAEIGFAGRDEVWGRPVGPRRHTPDTLHDMRSVTKSVIGLLYGIALAEGIVPPPEAPLMAQFPEYPALTGDPARAAITVGDVLSMRMGTEWNETLPYTDPRNSEIAMENAPDRYAYALGRAMVARPGTAWVYNGGAAAIAARLIEKGAGRPIDAYARDRLFTPLGITRVEWTRGADGVPSAASGLRLSLHDLATLGQMVVDDGRAGGRQVVPRAWIERMLAPRAETGFGLRYGYFWWRSAKESPADWSAAMGNGGQRLTVQPQFGLVIAVTAGNYNRPDDWKLPARVIEAFVIPAVIDAMRD